MGTVKTFLEGSRQKLKDKGGKFRYFLKGLGQKMNGKRVSQDIPGGMRTEVEG